MSRRSFMVLAAAASAGCARASAPSWPRRTKYEGVDFIELFPGGADEHSPLVVAIHGMGDKPDNWIESWKDFPHKVQIALPRAFTKYGDGFSWFDLHDGQTDAELGVAVGDAEAALWKAIERCAARRKLIVTGFSQGGILSFVMAARHPAEIVRAFPVAGACPGPLLPKGKSAPVTAFHGTADPVLPFKMGKGAVDAFKAQGNDATLRDYPGVGHTIATQERADLWAELAKSLPA